MRKLLRANFYSLRKSRALWLCMAAAFAFSAFFMLRFSASEESYTLDGLFMQVFPFLPILYAAFTSLFLGTEYQDGTLRNKLIVGHSRLKVYAAALVTAIVGCFAILLAWALSSMVGVLRFGWFTFPLGKLLMIAVLILLLTAALAAILTMLCMLTPNRAVSSVVCILLIFGLIALGSFFYNALCEPEFTTGAVATGNGFEFTEAIPNPAYVSGALRTVYQFLVDTLPTGQAILLSNQELARPTLSLCASACLTLLITAIGACLFQRKDLK